jgi:hypothetical protein
MSNINHLSKTIRSVSIELLILPLSVDVMP